MQEIPRAASQGERGQRGPGTDEGGQTNTSAARTMKNIPNQSREGSPRARVRAESREPGGLSAPSRAEVEGVCPSGARREQRRKRGSDAPSYLGCPPQEDGSLPSADTEDHKCMGAALACHLGCWRARPLADAPMHVLGPRSPLSWLSGSSSGISIYSSRLEFSCSIHDGTCLSVTMLCILTIPLGAIAHPVHLQGHMFSLSSPLPIDKW